MDGCLGWMIKSFVYLAVFLIGGVLGYQYVTGSFDGYMVWWEMSRLPTLEDIDAGRRVVIDATLARAQEDFSEVDQKFVLWTGELVESITMSNGIRRLAIQGDAEREFISYYDGNLNDVKIGDRVEVLGYARRIVVQSANQRDASLPQVIAFRVKEINPMVRSIQAAPPTTDPVFPAGSPSPASSTSPASSPHQDAGPGSTPIPTPSGAKTP